MRAMVQVLFLLLYVVSSYDTMQSRIAYIVDELQHSTSRSGTTAVDDACKVQLQYTHFREAKNVGTEYNFREISAPNVFPLTSSRQFTVQASSIPHHVTINASVPRAPPLFTPDLMASPF